MDRRTFIATGAAVPLATLPTAASTVDPLTGMFDDWVAARREWIHRAGNGADWDSAEMIALTNAQFAIMNQMAVTQAQTLEGLLCQIRLLWEDFGSYSVNIDTEDRTDPELRLKSRIVLGAEYLADTPTWQPIDPTMIPASDF